ncbi:MAG TPA: NAD(P)H-dependent glycerol-3-phosphate dehydrogenase [Ramlibacter sp.]|uniref:NAD(P)H-dependent glycerol-3-phosphate dehydrogenase n=1 Tax=Ramlibacter sp. TaxID=1917967 RepID=UPI002D7FD1B6|nr:NAD(P)H-dependent glycerol-3-phosphate dehydrogenase [Ramlibacter sp.]HET8746443.1 NAD(P)H-dependent glycerol-3-phosphate dehydrogenase [Ramlibacter sp.]
MDILVLGAGAWGTALAINAGRRHRVTLWARDPAQAAAIVRQGENAHYLAGHRLSAGVRVASRADGAPRALAARHELAIIATPMAALRQMLVELAGSPCPVAWLCKGFEAPVSRPYGLLGHEVRAEVAPQLAAGALSGPSFAQEVAAGQPTALVAASDAASVREALVAAFHGPSMRVYANDDLAGVEVGGAVKNVLAIATGLCDGLALGLNARAALITRGLAEMTRLGLALGARPDTFMGLSGLGDLVLTATGDLSRNRRVGLMLAQGRTLQQAVDSLGHVAEGVYSARTVVERAGRLGVEMPIAAAVVDLLDGRVSPAEAVAALMGRDPADERI